jgi:phosphoserine phosphatase RsbU/P
VYAVLGAFASEWREMQVGSSDALSAFRRDEIQLFIAAASIAVGLATVGFSFIRRRFDRLLSFFAWFAVLYGIRLWMQSSIHGLMVRPSAILERAEFALNFFVSIPAFLFFEASGFIKRAGRVTVYCVCLLEVALIAAVFTGVPLAMLDRANSAIVIVGSVTIGLLAIRYPREKEAALVFKIGLLIFIGFVLWTNGAELFGYRSTVELYGFAAFLCCLGYVAARRALDRDLQLNSIQQELEIARRIQPSILPKTLPAQDSFTITARYVPMTSVAGDFYELIANGSGGLGLLIADVSGHGIPAALIASMVKVAVQSQQHHWEKPERLLAGVNDVLCGNTQNQFVTAAYVHLDKNRGELRYGAAGHPPMLLLRSGQVIQIIENGLVLALMPGAAFTSIMQSLVAGDRLLLYTDGIVEAMSSREEEFGYDRLRDLLVSSESISAEEAADLILNTVRGWSPIQNDDLTIIVCDYMRNAQEAQA